jgi:hypothetical protein
MLAIVLASCLIAIRSQAQTEHVLFNTPAYEDPSSPVAMDAQGNLYASTTSDFHNRGSIFKLTPPLGSNGRWSATTIHVFPNGGNFESPGGNMVLDSAGNLFGATGSVNGSGVVYEITAEGETGSSPNSKAKPTTPLPQA